MGWIGGEGSVVVTVESEEMKWILCPLLEGLLSLFNPFVYQHVFIPYLPSHLSSCLECPCPFLIGMVGSDETEIPSHVLHIHLSSSSSSSSIHLPSTISTSGKGIIPLPPDLWEGVEMKITPFFGSTSPYLCPSLSSQLVVSSSSHLFPSSSPLGLDLITLKEGVGVQNGNEGRQVGRRFDVRSQFRVSSQSTISHISCCSEDPLTLKGIVDGVGESRERGRDVVMRVRSGGMVKDLYEQDNEEILNQEVLLEEMRERDGWIDELRISFLDMWCSLLAPLPSFLVDDDQIEQIENEEDCLKLDCEEFISSSPHTWQPFLEEMMKSQVLFYIFIIIISIILS